MLNDWMRQSGIPDKIDSRQSACMLSSKNSSPDWKSFCTWSKLHADLWQVTVFWSSIISIIILFLTAEWHVEIQIIGFKTHEQCYTKWFGLDGFQVCILTILWMSRSTECSYSNNWTNLPGTIKKQLPFRKVTYPTLGKGTLCLKVPLGWGYVSFQSIQSCSVLRLYFIQAWPHMRIYSIWMEFVLPNQRFLKWGPCNHLRNHSGK